jgi:hypothetical protein
MQVDVEQVGFTFCTANNVCIPNFFGEGLAHPVLLLELIVERE